VVSFELHESIYLDDVEEMVLCNLDRIRELGIGISIDDFGTGHASIISLLKLRPGRLKIDRQFLESLVVSEPQRSLVRSLIDIGKSLDIRVVAEGVETMDHVEILRRLGCDILQGYALARPMTAVALEAMLHKLQRRAS
jgi:EAL domain-containing protein (putative c-di-GMP-specific phosphodiesterase class I)